MRGNSIRAQARFFSLATLLAAVASLTLVASSPAAVTIGSSLAATPNDGGCGGGTFHAVDYLCIDSQASLTPAHTAAAGLVSPIDGVIVRWRVVNGTPLPDMAAVKLRLRTFRGPTTAGAKAAELVTLPLMETGLHIYPTRLSVRTGERLGVETLLTNQTTGSFQAPIVHSEPSVGLLYYWSSDLAPDATKTPFAENGSQELLLNADVEPDGDRDGYGDETQDGCPTDATTQGVCPSARDTTPPRTKLTYPQRQDFFTEKKVLVRFRSNEAATVIASGQLEWPRGKGTNGGRAIYPAGGVKRAVEAGKKTTLRLKVPGKTRKAALAALANGKRIVVKVTVFAKDAAGNQSGTTVAAIKPPR